MRPFGTSIVITLPEAWCSTRPGGRGSAAPRERPIAEARKRDVSCGWHRAHAGRAPWALEGRKDKKISQLIGAGRIRMVLKPRHRQVTLACERSEAQWSSAGASLNCSCNRVQREISSSQSVNWRSAGEDRCLLDHGSYVEAISLLRESGFAYMIKMRFRSFSLGTGIVAALFFA